MFNLSNYLSKPVNETHEHLFYLKIIKLPLFWVADVQNGDYKLQDKTKIGKKIKNRFQSKSAIKK